MRTLASLLVASCTVSVLLTAPLRGQAAPVPDSGANNNSTSSQDLGHGGASYEDFEANAEENKKTAWTLLTRSLGDAKHPEVRIQALAALSYIGGDPRALPMITGSLNDPDPGVRTAAILAAAKTGRPAVIPSLKRSLSDPSPQVSLAAARTLSSLNDKSGAEILKTASGQMDVLAPLGYGPAADKPLLTLGGGDPARIQAIITLAADHSAPTRKRLLEALKDKDAGVRIAAARALGTFTWTDIPPALAHLFYDKQGPVRLTAAAAFLETTAAMTPAAKKPAPSLSFQPDL